MVLTLMYQGLYPLGLRLSSSPKKFNHLFSVCASLCGTQGLPHARPELSLWVPSLVPPCRPTASVAVLHAVSICPVEQRGERRGQQLPLVIGASLDGAQALGEVVPRLPATAWQPGGGRACKEGPRLSEPVFPVVLQGLSARRQSCTLPVSLQCLSVVSGAWCLDSEVLSIATVTVWEPWEPVRVGLGQ